MKPELKDAYIVATYVYPFADLGKFKPPGTDDDAFAVMQIADSKEMLTQKERLKPLLDTSGNSIERWAKKQIEK